MSRHEVLWMLALGWAPAVIATAVPQLPCTQPAGNFQLAAQLGHGSGNVIGAASDANPASGFAVRDNFVIDAGGTITTVCWTGLYVDFSTPADCGPGTVPDSFTVTYYTNIEGLPPEPGAIVAGPFDVTASLVKAASGNLVPASSARSPSSSSRRPIPTLSLPPANACGSRSRTTQPVPTPRACGCGPRRPAPPRAAPATACHGRTPPRTTSTWPSA